ncbi:MAG: hypothetical protein AAB069_07160, partial [Planctomycetota bacterium]
MSIGLLTSQHCRKQNANINHTGLHFHGEQTRMLQDVSALKFFKQINSCKYSFAIVVFIKSKNKVFTYSV